MKKLLSILLVSVMLLSLVACGGSKKEETKTEEPPAEEVTYDISTLEGWGEAMKAQYDGSKITVAMSAHNSTEAFKSMVDEFTALTGIEVVWDIVEETNLKNKQLLDVQGAGSYDVMMVDAFWMSEYASKNVLIPIDTYANDASKTPAWFDYEDIMAAYRNGIAGANGVNYGIPTSGETRFIAYRTDLFEKYGKTAPATMDEFLELARFFNDVEDVEYGVWMSLMYNFGAGFVDQSTLDGGDVVVTTNSAETKESLQYFVDLMNCAPPDVGTYTHEEALGAFISGKTAMWLDATALAGQITDPASSTVADKVAFVPPPTGPAGDGAALAGWSLGISTASKNQDQAWAFICFMASREKAEEYILAGGGATRASVFENETLQAANPSFPAQLEALDAANGLVEKGLSWIPQHDMANQMLEIAGAYGSDALAGNISVDEACESAQVDIIDLIGG